VRLQEDAKKTGDGVVAVGGCLYDRYVAVALDVHGLAAASARSGGGADRPRGAALGPLPRSADEAKAIARGEPPLLGEQATVPRVRARLAETLRKRTRAVHFACHGLVDDAYPSLCALALTATVNDDGLLKVHEILGLDLSTDLVTLSACSTGRGSEIRGEGLFSVARAFMAAGSPRVLASLWKVDDDASAAFMRAFHRAYAAGATATEALRSTQLAMRKGEVRPDEGPAPASFREPKAWAAWVLWGAEAPPPAKAPGR
jgi:CHAT domain-containing protein